MTPSAIHNARLSLGMSQRAFAKALGMKGTDAARTVRRWERGEYAPSYATQKLIEYLLKESAHETTITVDNQV